MTTTQSIQAKYNLSTLVAGVCVVVIVVLLAYVATLLNREKRLSSELQSKNEQLSTTQTEIQNIRSSYIDADVADYSQYQEYLDNELMYIRDVYNITDFHSYQYGFLLSQTDREIPLSCSVNQKKVIIYGPSGSQPLTVDCSIPHDPRNIAYPSKADQLITEYKLVTPLSFTLESAGSGKPVEATPSGKTAKGREYFKEVLTDGNMPVYSYSLYSPVHTAGGYKYTLHLTVFDMPDEQKLDTFAGKVLDLVKFYDPSVPIY